ncbi:unnamed protein product [Vicia faba]|uniref:Uncharacterized protein n=1 Tax=Vicia faba TaxID=3906 RepID=A0AAV1AN01_VICFA|nr:unnamed protein product [Vicia faba]
MFNILHSRSHSTKHGKTTPPSSRLQHSKLHQSTITNHHRNLLQLRRSHDIPTTASITRLLRNIPTTNLPPHPRSGDPTGPTLPAHNHPISGPSGPTRPHSITQPPALTPSTSFLNKLPLPMFLLDHNDPSKLVFFYQGSGMQLGAEGFTVGFLYTLAGLLLAFMSHGLVNVKSVKVQRVVMIFALLVCFLAVKQVVFLDNWKTGYGIHGY